MDGEKFIDCNPKTLEMFDCKWEDIINQPPFKFSPPKQNDGQSSKTKALVKIKAALKGEPQFFEWVHCRLDRSTFQAEVSLNSVKLLTKDYLINFLIFGKVNIDMEWQDRLYNTSMRHMVEIPYLPRCPKQKQQRF